MKRNYLTLDQAQAAAPARGSRLFLTGHNRGMRFHSLFTGIFRVALARAFTMALSEYKI